MINNKYSPFQLQGDAIGKQVAEMFHAFAHSESNKDLNPHSLLDTRKLFDRFREFFFTKFPKSLELLKATKQEEPVVPQINKRVYIKGEKKEKKSFLSLPWADIGKDIAEGKTYRFIERKYKISWYVIRKGEAMGLTKQDEKTE
tara:strand:- start:1641 stop:2072 length:432 start_codon:yes stop_codon:yes gene_type:complete